MTRTRRSRGEPVWPLVLIVAVVGVGLGFGALFFRGADAQEGEETAADAPDLPTREDRVRVEVLNAGGVQGAAGDARDYLRGEGFDVVNVGNASEFGDGPTVVLDRGGDDEEGRAVARSLGAPEVRSAPDPTLLVDVTVLVGTDWEIGTVPALGAIANPAERDPEPDGEGERAWWDPRRIFDRTR